MASKYVDVSAIVQVIGNVFKNLSLLDEKDRYTINEEDFSNEFHKIVFGALYKIHEQGAKEVNLKTVSDFFETHPTSGALYKQQKGEEWLIKASDGASPLAFDYYYNRLKKMTLLRVFDNFGIDVSDIYDPDNILDMKKKQEQEELLDNCSLTDIASRVNDKIELIRMQYVDDVQNASEQAGEGVFDLIEKFKQYPEVGVPLYGPLINTVTRGARLKKFYLRSAATGIGKAIPNYTIIPTPDGDKRVDEIKVGDYLFGQDGKPTKVLRIYPQPESKEIWKVTFSNGTVAECCGEHLWEYRYETHRGKAYRVEDIETIYNRTLKLKNGLRDSSNKGYRFHIKVNKPVEFPKKEYYLHPYIMGAFLGDGSFRYNSSNKSLNFSSENEEIPNYISKLLGDEFYPHNYTHMNYNWVFKNINNQKHNISVEEFLKDFPELLMVKSEDKFIPKDYLYGSIDQRFELLQGLMDTDGSIDINGRMSFTTVSPQLRDDFIYLCRSLGFIVNYLIDKREDKYTTGECYKIQIQCKKEIKPKCFHLQRKKDRAIAYANSNKRQEFKDHIAIINIEKTDKKVPMTCFTVDNDSHLFLMNDFIVTHNTRSMVADACYIACSHIYNETFGWISTGACNPTLFITTEQELEEIQTMMLAFLSNVNEEHILNGKYEGDEENRVLKAAEILSKAPLYVEELPDFNLQDIENTIKRNIRDHDVRFVFHDYIHTSLKILEEITKRSGGVKLREDNILFMLSNRLKDLCNQYGIFIMSATQLNGTYKDSETPDQNLLRGAKSIADKIDYGSILLSVTTRDLEALQSILATNAFDTPTIKLSIYKNRRGRYKGIYLFCKADLGTCRIEPMFATTYNYDIIEIDNVSINVLDDDKMMTFEE